jgi:hypothetical protein
MTASARTRYRLYLWHPDGRWYTLSMATLSCLQYGTPVAIPELAGHRVRLARGILSAAANGAPAQGRLLRGQILRFDEKGFLIRSDLTRRLRAISGLLQESAAIEASAAGCVVDARGRFEAASFEWTAAPAIEEFLLAAMTGHVVLPEYVPFPDVARRAKACAPELC